MIIKYLSGLFLLISLQINAQADLRFDKRFIETQDRWVAIKNSKDNNYLFGFVYLDLFAGLTLQHEGSFTINPDGKFIPSRLDSNIHKIRLQPGDLKVALIPEGHFKELQVEAIPGWLQIYKKDAESPKGFFRTGFLYNQWNEPAKALSFLEKLYKIQPDYEGLIVEMAFSYNASGQFDKAIALLESVIPAHQTDCYYYKELSFAYMQKDQLEKASTVSKEALQKCEQVTMKGEMAYNLTYSYYLKKDKKNFKYWAEEVKKWAAKDPRLGDSLTRMEAEMDKL
jgi:tetratricopeptide (TPR) repeat protein